MERRDLFVSIKGEMLDRWREAYPVARSVRLVDGRLDGHGGAPGIVWLRAAAGDDTIADIDRVRQRWPDAAVVVLADVPDDEQALACFGHGIRGYCNSHAQPALLRTIGEVVGQGGLWLGESLVVRLLRATASALPPTPGPEDWAGALTDRETQVARAIAAGAANKEIARQLGITERTVKAHTGAIFQKLGVRDRLQLSLLIHRHGS